MCNWIIDLGPEGGDEIVASGAPEEVVKVKRGVGVAGERAEKEDGSGGVAFLRTA